MTLGEEMVMYRARHGLSTKDAAAACGISDQTWRYVEKGLQQALPVTEAKIRLFLKEANDESEH